MCRIRILLDDKVKFGSICRIYILENLLRNFFFFYETHQVLEPTVSRGKGTLYLDLWIKRKKEMKERKLMSISFPSDLKIVQSIWIGNLFMTCSREIVVSNFEFVFIHDNFIFF